MHEFEKLGAFYLGKSYDLPSRRRGEQLVLYDSKDLVTHAVCVGMTGSGKTGLCIGLLEEAAIDGVPAIVIDPKGDLANLLLTFPQLRPADFEPWINAEDASKKGLTPAQFAAQQAALWTRGLAEWGQDGARIQRLRDAADFAIYTPGSTAGLPVSILKSFAAPAQQIIEDRELLQERVSTTATSLLGMLGIQADPIRSREHIVLSTILNAAWSAGRDLDLAMLIQQVQKPPVSKLGVMDLDTVFPAADRFALAMQINNLLAAPGFSTWLEGEALDIGAMLVTPAGKPRVAIFSIAHLGDAERMFFVSLLLNQVLGWVRAQSGTTSLRAILYMDEIAGYFPPVANPPSKQPLLTLMKQARAYGLGVVLATQNPVDLDYKGLANAGTWFIGRLQTERDKARVLDGLEGAAASASSGFDRSEVEKAISQLGSRVFLMNNVHEDGPLVFETRWAMSYLRGPLTRSQIRQLVDSSRGRNEGAIPQAGGAAASAATTVLRAQAVAAPSMPAATAPVVGPEVAQFFAPIRGLVRADVKLIYEPRLLGLAKVFLSDSKLGIELNQSVAYLAALGSGPVPVDWDHAESAGLSEADLEREPYSPSSFDSLPAEANRPKSYDMWKKQYGESLYRQHKLELLRSAAFDEVARPGESEGQFRQRLLQIAREQRDAFAEGLRRKYAPKVAALTERLRKARQAVEVQEAQARDAKVSSALSFGTALLGAFLGRKKISATTATRAGTAMRSASRATRESGDVGRAEATVDSMQQQLADLERRFQEELAGHQAENDPLTERLETVALRPKKTNVAVSAVVLAWLPMWVADDGTRTAAWR